MGHFKPNCQLTSGFVWFKVGVVVISLNNRNRLELDRTDSQPAVVGFYQAQKQKILRYNNSFPCVIAKWLEG